MNIRGFTKIIHNNNNFYYSLALVLTYLVDIFRHYLVIWNSSSEHFCFIYNLKDFENNSRHATLHPTKPIAGGSRWRAPSFFNKEVQCHFWKEKLQLRFSINLSKLKFKMESKIFLCLSLRIVSKGGVAQT